MWQRTLPLHIRQLPSSSQAWPRKPLLTPVSSTRSLFPVMTASQKQSTRTTCSQLLPSRASCGSRRTRESWKGGGRDHKAADGPVQPRQDAARRHSGLSQLATGWAHPGQPMLLPAHVQGLPWPPTRPLHTLSAATAVSPQGRQRASKQEAMHSQRHSLA